MRTTYEIRVRGHLDQELTEWLAGLKILNLPEGEALLSGPIVDQAALHGVLAQLHQLGLSLISVNQVPTREQC